MRGTAQNADDERRSRLLRSSLRWQSNEHRDHRQPGYDAAEIPAEDQSEAENVIRHLRQLRGPGVRRTDEAIEEQVKSHLSPGRFPFQLMIG